ncbi:MAG: DUF3048 domain-containing protein [Oscillospiraceae bacterium]|nr:DUF3048 domain-containing protein [Oscillospiraceae bacterium]
MKHFFSMTLALLLLLSACTNREVVEETPEPTAEATAEPTPTPTPSPTATPEPTEEPEPAYRNPFNGAALDEPYSGRPFTVMLNNLNIALPQCGNGEADIIFECLAEGGITRMIGIYSDITGIEKLGPVRSIRPYFIDIALSFGAVICHAGGSTDAYTRLYTGGLSYIDGVNGSYSFSVFYRDQQRLASAGYEHSLFTTGDDLYKAAEERNYTLETDDPETYDSGFHFTKDGAVTDGEAADTISVSFGAKTTTLHYDADSGLYSMEEYGSTYIDANTGDAVTFRNFLAIYASTSVLDSYGRLSVDLFTGGTGYFACGGAYVPITWEHESTNDCFHFYLEDGSELLFGEGSSYVAVLPTSSGSVEFTGTETAD